MSHDETKCINCIDTGPAREMAALKLRGSNPHGSTDNRRSDNATYVIHYASTPFIALCGADENGQHTTDSIDLATCLRCIAKIPVPNEATCKAADDFICEWLDCPKHGSRPSDDPPPTACAACGKPTKYLLATPNGSAPVCKRSHPCEQAVRAKLEGQRSAGKQGPCQFEDCTLDAKWSGFCEGHYLDEFGEEPGDQCMHGHDPNHVPCSECADSHARKDAQRSAEATDTTAYVWLRDNFAGIYGDDPRIASLTKLLDEVRGRESDPKIDWAKVSSAEVIRAVGEAPVIYGPWVECSITQGWTRWELFPGPSWKGSSVHVQPCHPRSLGWGVSYRDKYRNGFGTSGEAQDVGDEWLREAGCRLDGALPSSGNEPKEKG